VRKTLQFLAVGALLGVGMFWVPTIASSSSASAARRHSVTLDCSPIGDQRTAADSSVQPGVIVDAFYSFSDFSFTPYTIDSTGHLQIVGASQTYGTTDHLVAAWVNSTNCLGWQWSRNAWVVDASGAVFGENDLPGPPANNLGDTAGVRLDQPMVGMSPRSDGQGYWLVASDGGIFTFGDAAFHGSTGGIALNQPVVGMATTPDGGGYTLVASDGGIFTFGDAPFYGSLGSIHLTKPIEAMIATPDGRGYWMVASDGGIFSFGDAAFHGSLGGRTLSAPIAGMIPNGTGYTLIGQDGQLYPFS
jgi:hypothetical protein